MGKRRDGEDAALRRLRSVLEAAPRAALKAARKDAGLSQSQLAREVGIAGTQLADVEGGRRNLTPAMAKRLAPALKMGTGENVETAHLVGGVKRLAADDPDALTPEILTQLVAWLDARLPETALSGDLVGALLGLLKEKIVAYEEQRRTKVATKSAAGKRPDRDRFGRRVHKPYRPRI